MNMNNAQFERLMDGRHNRRLAAEDRALARAERAEAKAAPMIGELCREGVSVFYCWPAGGRYYESANFYAVVDYLARNRWVRV